MRLSCWKSPGCIRLIEKFSYPLVLWTSTVLNFAVPNLNSNFEPGNKLCINRPGYQGQIPKPKGAHKRTNKMAAD